MGCCCVGITVLRKIKKLIKKCDGNNGSTRIVVKNIQIAVKIDERQHDKFVDKKPWSKLIFKYKLQSKRNPMALNVTEKKIKKNCYVCVKMNYFKRNCPKKTMEMSAKWIEMIEKPETTTKLNHENLSWTTCNDDQCGIYRLFKNNVKWYPKKMLEKKPNISCKFYPTKTPFTAIMVIKIGKSKILGLIKIRKIQYRDHSQTASKNIWIRNISATVKIHFNILQMN